MRLARSARRGDVELSYDLGDLAGTRRGGRDHLVPSGQNQAVLVVAAADLAAVETRLRPQIGKSLCGVLSRWTKNQLDSAGTTRTSAGSAGTSTGSDHSTPKTARLTSPSASPGVLPEIAVWAASLLPGIVTLEPWLIPADGDRGATG